jgi:RNA polymerase sigma-70 factor (ECF subfamily)
MEFISMEDNSRLIAGMELLSEKYRSILALRYFEDCDYATIARKMHKPLGTVKSLIHRAHERLYQLMADVAIQEGKAVVN